MEHSVISKKIRLSLLLNTGYAVLELFAGFWSGSLALISDATHNLTDSATLVVSFVAQKISQKKPKPEHTFGYGKARILAALINSLIMLGLAATVFYSAYQRWDSPKTVDGGIIAAVAGIGIIINGAVASLFFKHRNDLNIKSAFLNMAFDTITSAAALASGVVIYYTHFEKIDALVSVFIGIMMVIGCAGIINQAVHIILEGAPEDIDPRKVTEDLKKIPGVAGVDDFHLWVIASGNPALSCHLVLEQTSAAQAVILTKQAKSMLSEKYRINQTAIEVGTENAPEHEH